MGAKQNYHALVAALWKEYGKEMPICLSNSTPVADLPMNYQHYIGQRHRHQKRNQIKIKEFMKKLVVVGILLRSRTKIIKEIFWMKLVRG